MNLLGSEEVGYCALESCWGKPSDVFRETVPALYGSRQKTFIEKTPLFWVVSGDAVPVVTAGMGDELVEVWAGG